MGYASIGYIIRNNELFDNLFPTTDIIYDGQNFESPFISDLLQVNRSVVISCPKLNTGGHSQIVYQYDPTLIVVSISSLLDIPNGYCLFNQRNGIHALANSFHVRRCQSEGVEVFRFGYLSFTDDKEGLFTSFRLLVLLSVRSILGFCLRAITLPSLILTPDYR